MAGARATVGVVDVLRWPELKPASKTRLPENVEAMRAGIAEQSLIREPDPAVQNETYSD
jgi:hypothetical protein